MSFAETTHHDEGVTTTRSTAGLRVCLPRPSSANHELGILAVLWELWTVSRKGVLGADVEWTVDVCEFDELTIPSFSVISAISAELSQTGRKLLLVGDPHMPSFTNNRTLQAPCLKRPSARIAGRSTPEKSIDEVALEQRDKTIRAIDEQEDCEGLVGSD